MKDKIIVHLDMNSYFASVEQQANPFLRDKPVAVCAYLSPRGAIIASSVEAKAKGIKVGVGVQQAKLLAPDVVFVENEPAKYRCVTKRIFKIMSEYSDALEPYSIDEAFLDLTGWVKDYEGAKNVCLEIKERIKNEVGEWLKCSTGISYTKFLAKFAGDIAPKNGLEIITKENLDSYLDRDLIDAWGIGRAMSVRLRLMGIATLKELKEADPIILKRFLGIYGYYLWCNVNGKEITKVENGIRAPKSIGHSYCLAKRTREKKYLQTVLAKLSEKTGRRLRALEFEAKSAHLYLQYMNGGHLTKTIHASDGFFTTHEFLAPLYDFLGTAELSDPVRMMAVTVTHLSPVSEQLGLFSDRRKAKNISRAMDLVNNRYGEYTVTSGLLFDTQNIARDRVGFRKTVSFEE
jgi:DNA polymerase-4